MVSMRGLYHAAREACSRFVNSLLIAVVLGILGPPAPSRSERRAEQETVPGALERANRALEPWNRGLEMRRENQGARARVSATNDAANEVELPRALTPGFSEWTRF